MPVLREYVLHDHMQSYLAPEDEDSGTGNLLPFHGSSRQQPSFGSSTLDLIDEAAQRIAETNRFAAESLARVDSLAREALEQLSAAEKRIAKAEADRAEAEAALEQLREKLERDFFSKLEQLEQLKEEADARIESAEDKLREAEARAHSAEERAKAMEETFERIEAAVSSKILDKSRYSAANMASKQTLGTSASS
jgi:chromosome segregation ATPase